MNTFISRACLLNDFVGNTFNVLSANLVLTDFLFFCFVIFICQRVFQIEKSDLILVPFDLSCVAQQRFVGFLYVFL